MGRSPAVRASAATDARAGGSHSTGRMRRLFVFVMLTTGSLFAASAAVPAQTPTPPVRRPAPASAPAPPPSAPRISVAPDVSCPTPLGVGVASKLTFCDVLSGRNPADGVL